MENKDCRSKYGLGQDGRSADGFPVRLLTLHVNEPLPGQVLPEMAADAGADEAARRYRAIVVTTLRQLQGLENSRIRLIVSPEDGEEAVRFWLLPRLADHWQSGFGIFRSAGWEIDFGNAPGEFSIHATADVLCPYVSARWVHAGLLGLGKSAGRIVGPASDGGMYLQATLEDGPGILPDRLLPELLVIRTEKDWQTALDSPLGAALKKAWEVEE